MRIHLERIRLIKAIKNFFKFIFFGEGVASDIAFLIFIALLFRFVIYPGLGLFLGTPYPIVIVMSDSMEHENFDPQWYLDHGFTLGDLKDLPFPQGLNKGDIVFVHGARCKDYKKGDVAVYIVPNVNFPIIHRIVSIEYVNNTCYFTFKGDNNPFPLPFEKNLSEKYVVGKAFFRIPYVGLPKVWLNELINTIR